MLCSLSLLALVAPALAPQTPEFAEVHRQIPLHPNVRSVALADLDGDGDVDAFFGAIGQDHVDRNDGGGGFASVVGAVPVWEHATASVVLRDFDNDGDLDVLRDGGWGLQGEMELLRGDGTGIFTSDPGAVPMPILAIDVAVGDVDLDGWQDALAVGYGGDVLLSGGPAGFSLAAAQPPDTPKLSWTCALGDLDGDGDLDIYVGKDGVQDVLLFNQGPAGFTASNLPTKPATTTAVTIGDVDLDGDADLVAGQESFSSSSDGAPVYLYLGDGAGGFQEVHLTQMPALLVDVTDVLLADVDGDGDPDLVLATDVEHVDRVFRNDGGGGFQEHWELQEPGWWLTLEAAAADLDGDGDTDLAFARTNGTALFFGDGAELVNVSGGLDAPWLAHSDTSTVAALVDAGGDGDLDVVVVAHGGPMRLHANDGFGRYAPGPDVAVGQTAGIDALAVVDADSNGVEDLLLGYDSDPITPTQHVRLFLGGAGDSYAEAPAGSVPAVAHPLKDIAVGDVDADGNPDAFLALYTADASNVLLLGDGAGGFSDASPQLPLHAALTAAGLLGDLDADGDLDAVVAGSPSRVYVNDGGGGFTLAPPQTLPEPSGFWPSEVALVDLDVSGTLDVVALGTLGVFEVGNFVFFNGGSGSFTKATLPFSFVQPIAAFDAEYDGDPDLLVGGRYFENDGSGGLSEVPAALPGLGDALGYVAEVLVGDVDHDAEWDVYFARGFQEDRLLYGVKRQLEVLSLTQIGGPLSMRIRGPSGQVWFLALALQPGHTALPPFGTLLLDPAAYLVVGVGLCDASGVASVAFPAVTNPALLGFTVYWQALVGDSPHLTNQERTTLLDL